MKNSPDPIILNAPASKSMSHRALIASGLAMGESRLSNVLDSDDLDHTRKCLEALGVEISGTGADLKVKGISGKISVPGDHKVSLDVGESGTTCRLIAAVAAAGKGEFEISGRGRMHQRPIKSLDKALTPLGIRFTYQGIDGCPPLTIISNGLPGGEISISLDESSQYLSGILLASTMAADDLTINLTGKKVVSWPYVSLTLQVMEQFGVVPEIQVLDNNIWKKARPSQIETAQPGKIRFIVHPAVFTSRDYQVEGDFSNASYLLAAGAIGNKPVLVRGLDPGSRQGDRAILDILEKMGAVLHRSERDILVQARELSGVDLDMSMCPDLVPTLAVLASLANGKTRISNVAHLKIKESDRLKGVYDEISRTGCRCELLDDGLVIDPVALNKGQSIEFSTYNDHRMAMSLSLYELAGIRVSLDNPGCVNKSFPGFWKEWEKIRRAYE
ncbi:MAG: 3-phosphoshikimate 1-carboxyvinyltransferase [Desulfonatronovibrio sp.]